MTSSKPIILRGLRMDSLGTLWQLRDDGLWESNVNRAVFPLAEVESGPYGPTRQVLVADEARDNVVAKAVAWRDTMHVIARLHPYDAVEVASSAAAELVAAVNAVAPTGVVS